jgi:hypothetical protein
MILVALSTSLVTSRRELRPFTILLEKDMKLVNPHPVAFS